MTTAIDPSPTVDPFTAERQSARISINKLGEYLSAGPTRRRTILTEQRNPRVFQVTWYRWAERAIRSFLVDHLDDAEHFLAERERIAQLEITSRHDEVRQSTNLAAMDAFMAVLPELPIDGASMFAAHDDAPHVSFGGVEVSVRPEVILTGANSKGLPRVGALKLFLSQSHPLDDTTGLYVAAVLHQFAEEHLTDHGVADPQLCIVVDVFQRKFWTAPRHYKRRVQDIDAACEEIAAMWG